jgi:hypothetical protein
MKERLDEKLALDAQNVEIAKKGLLKFGKLSTCYLMRKLKCSDSKAKEIIMQLSNATEH